MCLANNHVEKIKRFFICLYLTVNFQFWFVISQFSSNRSYIFTDAVCFSTREIKPNQTDIGRKVKVKQTRPPIPPPRKEPPSLSIPSMRDSLLKPSYQPTVPSKLSPQLVHSSTNGISNGLGSNHVSSSRPQLNNKKPSVPNVAKRPLKYVYHGTLDKAQRFCFKCFKLLIN